jgi:hypothetical protein
MAWLPTYGTGRQPPRIGTGTYWLKASNMVLQDIVVTLGEPRHVTVTGDNAYVVVPASMTYKVHDTGHADWRNLYGGSP